MTAARVVTVGLLVPCLACGSGKRPSGDGGLGTGDAAADASGAASCPGPYERLTAETSGHELALAHREHTLTHGEKALMAALWAVLIAGTREGARLEQDLFERLLNSSALLALPTRYPMAARPCAPSPASQAVISTPFQCTDDCLISIDDVVPFLVEPLARALRPLGGVIDIHGESLLTLARLKAALADPALAGQGIENAAVAAISQDNAGAFLAAIFDVIGKAAAVSAAVLELGGAVELAPAIAATGATLALGLYVLRLRELALRIEACREWKVRNCVCTGPACGCAELGAPAQGVICCAQGGPSADGDWYVNTASPTCCVLNRAEYGKHDQRCFNPPDKTPGPCPSCRSDTECCDRQGAESSIDRCVGGRCCGPDGPERPGTATVVDFTCCSGVRYALNSPTRTCAPAP